MTKKIYFASVCLAITFTLNSCLSESAVNQTKQNQSFSVQSAGSEPTAIPTSGPSDVKSALANKSEPDSSLTYTAVNSQPDEKTFVDFSNVELPKVSTQDYAKYKIIPGQIQVVLKDEYGLKVNENQSTASKLVSTKNSSEAQQLNNVLTNRQIKKAVDMAQNMSEQKVSADQEAIKRYYQGYIPSRYSLQTYTFSNDADLVDIIQELRSQPAVYSANLVYEVEISYTKTQLSNINTNASPVTNPSAPSDPGFAQPETQWWWFNRHKVLDGWTQYGGTTMPTVAVIDSGFDTNASAVDRPNYLSGAAILGCSGLNVGCTFSYGLSAVVEATHPNRSFSHGTQVASLVGSPKNNGSMLSGVAPNAPIYPIRITAADSNVGTIAAGNLATAINHAKQQSSVDVISFSITKSNVCPSSMANNDVKNEVMSAIASYGKIVVAAAGNLNQNLQLPASGYGCGTTTGGEIIVGGLSSDTIPFPNRTKGWSDGFSGSNYDSSSGTAASFVDIAAAAENIRVPWFDPNTGNRGEAMPSDPYPDGTSFATPIVAGTAGMMKKIAAASGLTLNHAQVKNILVGAADVSRYSPGNIINLAESKFLGENLDYQYGTRIAGVRSLNVNNAITVAKNMKQYPVIVRLHNVDDSLEATINGDWTQKIDSTYGRDKIVGYKNITAGSTLNFRTYNGGGGYSFGYTLFKNNNLWWQNLAGVSGVSGAEGTNSKPVGYYGAYSSTL